MSNSNFSKIENTSITASAIQDALSQSVNPVYVTTTLWDAGGAKTDALPPSAMGAFGGIFIYNAAGDGVSAATDQANELRLDIPTGGTQFTVARDVQKSMGLKYVGDVAVCKVVNASAPLSAVGGMLSLTTDAAAVVIRPTAGVMYDYRPAATDPAKIAGIVHLIVRATNVTSGAEAIQITVDTLSVTA